MSVRFDENYSVFIDDVEFEGSIKFENFYYSINFFKEEFKGIIESDRMKRMYNSNNHKLIVYDSITNTWKWFGEKDYPVELGFYNNNEIWTNDFRTAKKLISYVYNIKILEEKYYIYEKYEMLLEYIPMQRIFILTSKELINGKNINVISRLEIYKYYQYADSLCYKMI